MKKIALILFAFCIISGCNVLDKPKVVKKESVSSVKKESNLKKADVSVQIINEIDFDNISNGWNNNAAIIIKNNSDYDGVYSLVWSEITNTISDNKSLTMEIVSSNGGLNDYNIVVPKKEGIIKKNVKIKANDTQNYSFTFNYIGNEADKILKGKIDVK